MKWNSWHCCVGQNWFQKYHSPRRAQFCLGAWNWAVCIHSSNWGIGSRWELSSTCTCVGYWQTVACYPLCWKCWLSGTQAELMECTYHVVCTCWYCAFLDIFSFGRLGKFVIFPKTFKLMNYDRVVFCGVAIMKNVVHFLPPRSVWEAVVI